MSEVVKRLEPLDKTKRILWLESGGYCCKCMAPLITPQRDYIGKIAHIEAASQGGPRFNPEQSNDDRRKENNLMLVCPNCHDEIDLAESTFSVDVLYEMKRKHIKKFEDLKNSFITLVGSSNIVYPKNLNKLYGCFGYSDDEIKQVVEGDLLELKELLDTLNFISPNVREYLKVLMIEAVKSKDSDFENLRLKRSVSEQLTSLSPASRLDYFDVLKEKGLAYYDDYDDTINLQFKGRDINWLAALIFDFSKDEQVLEKLLLNLDFSILDN